MTLFLFGVLLAGCASKIVHNKYNKDGKGDGVPLRLTESRTVYWTYTAREDIGECRSYLQSEIQDNVPSSDHYTISYSPKLFERSKTQLTVNDNGTLRSINVESTPVSVDDLVKIAEQAAKISAPVPLPVSPSGTEKSTEDEKTVRDSLESNPELKSLGSEQKKAVKNAIRQAIEQAKTQPCTIGKLIVHSCPVPVKKDCLSTAQSNFMTWQNK